MMVVSKFFEKYEIEAVNVLAEECGLKVNIIDAPPANSVCMVFFGDEDACKVFLSKYKEAKHSETINKYIAVLIGFIFAIPMTILLIWIWRLMLGYFLSGISQLG
jgi:hypothetical protein